MGDSDLFEDLFSLEDNFYEQGYAEGQADGLKKARLEAYIFGIEQGFAKFKELGALQAKAAEIEAVHRNVTAMDSANPFGSRLTKHLETLRVLVDPATLSFENDDAAVSACDDRIKRAKAKITVIERVIGATETPNKRSMGPSHEVKAMEDFGR